MLGFDPVNIHMWIAENEFLVEYPHNKIDKKILSMKLEDLTIIDCETKDVFMPDCGAFVETDKGYHFLFPPDDLLSMHSLQDQKYLRIARMKGYWSQFIESKETGKRRLMISNKTEWDGFVYRWNKLVEETLGA